MEQTLTARRPLWIAPLALLAGAGIAGIFVSLSADDDKSEQALPGLTYEMERPAKFGPMALVVTSVQRDSDAEGANIVVGDIIAKVDGQKISSPGEVGQVLSRKVGQPISLRLRRSGIWVDKSLPALSTQGKDE